MFVLTCPIFNKLESSPKDEPLRIGLIKITPANLHTTLSQKGVIHFVIKAMIVLF